MLVEKPELLKDWLKGELRKISDADPIALGKYILALVKKDKKKDLKMFLLEQLEIFLKNDTSKFVEHLLETLQTKSYFKKATVPDDATTKLSSVVEIPIASSQSTTNVKSTSDSTNKDILKDKEKDKELSLRTDFDLMNKSPHRTENSGLPLKRKSVFDKHNSVCVEKESCKPSYKNEFADKARQKSNSKLEVKCTPGAPEESKSELGPSPKKIKHIVTHGDTDYRVGKTHTVSLQSTITPLTENVPKQRECPSYSTKPKPSTRCKDYDEKGYCLRGNFCGFDHGSDPILVENTPKEFLTNFGFLSSDKYEGTKSPLPPLPTSPPRIPPLPPLPPPTGFVAEYNPEAPGMNITHLNFFNPSEPPPELPSMAPKCSTRMQNLYLKKDSYIKPKQSRTRELINVTETVDSSNKFLDKSENNDTKTYLKPLNSVYTTGRESGNHTSKRFDFSRLGTCPRTLEIRKIPSRLNTISNLHQHFAKFGSIVNIEIAVDNDPESARISFSKNSEATAAYRSTDAILQNRFIKVFWSQPPPTREKKRTDNFFTNFSKEINTRNFNTETYSPPENLKVDNISEMNDDGVEREVCVDKVNENPVKNLESMPRSVFLTNAEAKKTFPKGTIAKPPTQEAAGISAKKITLQKAKSKLLTNAVEHQRVILNQLVKSKKKTEKAFLKKVLDDLSKQISTLTQELTKDNEELKVLLKNNKPQVASSKIVAKEILDAELDLYKKQHTQNADETTELLMQKVNVMKTKAKALGLLGPAHGMSYAKRGFGRNANPRVSSLSIDHRTKKLLVGGKKTADIEDLGKHFSQFGELENLEEAADGIVVSFSTRAEAEAALFYGNKIGDDILRISWINDSQLNASHVSESYDQPEEKAFEMISAEVEEEEEDEEEEEEEEEARSWRR